MKAIVTGSKGLLGRNIIPLLSGDFEIYGFDIDEWDITDPGRGRELIRQIAPGVLINLAAATDVDGCEDRRDLAEKVNVRGPEVLARLCAEKGVRLVHMSTDYVFRGDKGTPYTEEDVPDPVSFYGVTKLAGERKIMESHPSPLIIRTEWLYGKGGASFVTKIVAAARSCGSVQVVDDQTGCPTFARDLAAPVAALVRKGLSGIYHVANSGSATWFAFAKEIFALLGLGADLTPTTSERLARKARRPSYSVLDCTRLTRDTGIVMRPWQEALQEFLSEPL